MAYATTAQLAVALGRGDDPFTPAEEARAEQLLDQATADIDRELGQTLALASTTAEIDGTGTAVLLLPRWPVTAVATVSVIDDLDQPAETLVEDVDFRWSRWGKLRRLRRRCWPCIERAVTVTYTAGWDEVPADVVGICLRLAQSAWPNPTAVDSERLGDWSTKYATPGGNLTTAELSALGYYRART